MVYNPKKADTRTRLPMKKIALLFTSIAILSAVTAGAGGCIERTISYDPKPITIVNESGQGLSIQDTTNATGLPPGIETTVAFSGPDVKIRLENDKGETVFDKTYNYAELDGMNNRVVVPPALVSFFNQITAEPEKYSGQTVTFTGYVFHGFESTVICQFLEPSNNTQDTYYRPGGIQIWYTGNLPNEVDKKLHTQKNDPTGYPAYYGKIEVTGILEFGESYGHLGAYRYQLQVTGAKLIEWEPEED